MAERVLRALGVVAVVTPFLLGLAATGVDRDGRQVFRFQDPEIVESSGLVIEGDQAHTINDSGDIGRVFTVDTATGETVGTTFWAEGPEDVEALAPGGPGHVWVADIGDNTGSRDSIRVTRVPVGEGDRTVEEAAFDLVYPDGQRDAEALLVHPVTGRLYVATKGVFAGELYAAPPELADDAPNTLGLLGETTGIVTDGAFFSGGQHLVLRTYTNAVVYSFPALEPLGSFDLPSQEQGEGIAAPTTDAVYLSSEGQQAPVLRVPLPREIHKVLSSVPTPAPSPTPSTAEPDGALDRDAWPWFAGALVLGGVLVVLMRSLRARQSRRGPGHHPSD